MWTGHCGAVIAPCVAVIGKRGAVMAPCGAVIGKRGAVMAPCGAVIPPSGGIRAECVAGGMQIIHFQSKKPFISPSPPMHQLFWDALNPHSVPPGQPEHCLPKHYLPGNSTLVTAVNKLGGSVGRVMIMDHGASWEYGGQMFGNHPMNPEELKFIAKHIKSTLVLCGCATGDKSSQFNSLKRMSQSIPGIRLVGYSGLVYHYGKNKYGVPLGSSTRPSAMGTYTGNFPVKPQFGSQWTLFTK